MVLYVRMCVNRDADKLVEHKYLENIKQPAMISKHPTRPKLCRNLQFSWEERSINKYHSDSNIWSTSSLSSSIKSLQNISFLTTKYF